MIKPEQTDEISVNREQQLEEALLQKELLSSIFDTVPCGILRLTRKGASYGLISINPAAIRLLGYQEVELSQLDWSSGIADTVLAEDYKILLDSYQNLQKTRRQSGGCLSGTLAGRQYPLAQRQQFDCF